MNRNTRVSIILTIGIANFTWLVADAILSTKYMRDELTGNWALNNFHFLQADFNKDRKFESIQLDPPVGPNQFSLVVRQGNKQFLKVPYYDTYKEPFLNTRVAINTMGQKDHLLIMGGRPPKNVAYEFIGDKMEVVSPSKSDQEIFSTISSGIESPWLLYFLFRHWLLALVLFGLFMSGVLLLLEVRKSSGGRTSA